MIQTQFSLHDWDRLVQLPFLVLVSFRTRSGGLHPPQVRQFVKQIMRESMASRARTTTQLFDDALNRTRKLTREVLRLNPSAVLTHVRQAVNTARRALNRETFEDYLASILAIQRCVADALPLRARFARILRRAPARSLSEAVRMELTQALENQSA
ncbi:MAG: hypothetical protein H6953_14165 [Chromatiaceae bacterium]|nr:hypothetical protein [Chromatiaceae bacterium]MCP5312137.1 hypothetical protein [Chromatiaceae bacterium]